MEKVYKIGKSEIEGEGLIAIKDLVAGDLVGLSHVNNEATPDVGKFHNHSDNANTVNVEIGNERYLIVEKPIKKGEEITVNYRLQPDLEQPEDFLDKALDGGGINYPISGEVSYVNGDNMTLQPTRSKTYANDILGQLTYEQQVNGNPFEVKQRVGVRKNPDGSESTHLMRTETIDGINWVSFPTLFQNPDGSWLDMSNEENWKIPMMEAKKRGELVYFGKDKKAALEFGKGSWKSDEKSIMDREQTIPKAQWGKGFKLTNNTTTGQIGSGIGGNTIFRGIKGLPAANTFHTNWYTHPNYIANTNNKHNWNLRDFNESLINNEFISRYGADGLPLVHKSALVQQSDGTFKVDKSQVDQLASKFSMKDYESGIVPKDFYWLDQWSGGNPVPYSATGSNIYEKFPFSFSQKFVPKTRLNPENLQISGLYDEFKYNMAQMPNRVKGIYNNEFIPSWKKPGMMLRNTIRPLSEYLNHSISIGGHAGHMMPGDKYMPDSKNKDMYAIDTWRKYAPSLEVYKGFSNTPISGQMSLNYNPIMKYDPTTDLSSVVVHERGHLMDNSGGIYPNKYMDMFSTAVKGPSTGLFSKLNPLNRMGFGYDYFTDPTEQYARMMQERHRLGLTPADEYTFDMFKQNPKMFGMGKYLQKDEFGIPQNFIHNMNTIYKEGGSLPKAQFGLTTKLFGKQPRTKSGVITNLADDINLYSYNYASDIFGNTGAMLSGSVDLPIDYAKSLRNYRQLQNTSEYDPSTMFLMNEYTVDSAPFKFSEQDWLDNPRGWQASTLLGPDGKPLQIGDNSLALALSNKIQGNNIAWRNTTNQKQPINLTRNFNLGVNTLSGIHGDIGQLKQLYKTGDPYQLGSITSWGIGSAGLPQFGADRYIIKDFDTKYPALLNEYKGLTNNQAKVWKERELLLDNPTFKVTDIIENAPRIPHWRITTSPETVLKGTHGAQDWKIGEDIWDYTKDGSVITKYNPFNKYILGKRNPYYGSLQEISRTDPNFKIKAIPEYGTDIELKIIKKKGGEIMKKSKYQDSPFTKGKITYSDPTEVLNNLISQGIFTSEFKMGGEKKLDNGFTVKKEFDLEKNIPYVTYMKEPSIEGRLYYDSDSKDNLDDFNIIDVESELIKRKIKHKRTKDIILKYQNGEELSNAERARLNSLGLLD